jgi:murein DD-endopeptidase MepM/ murein hydrolase activator NlpD
MVRVRVARRAAVAVAIAAPALIIAACSQDPAPVELRQPWQASRQAPPKPVPKPALATAPMAPVPLAVTVVKGDTVFGIARRYGISVRAVIEANRLRAPFILRIGQRLSLPARRIHVVGPGETLYAISRLYDVDMSSLTRANGIGPPFALRVGQRLALPGPTGAAAPTQVAAAPPTPKAQPAPRSTKPAAKPAPASRATPAVPASPPRAGRRFAWPVQGKVISPFGPKAGGLHNDGINIAGQRGAPVRAAENGIVAYAGNELRGFGHLVLLRHAGGWMTAYAHNDVVLVRHGETVKLGQAIARLGATGNVSQPQLHFEIRRGSKAVDPLGHLAPRTAGIAPAGSTVRPTL